MMIAIAFAASVLLGTETTIYKSTAPDGSVAYSSEGPEPGATDVEKLRIITPPAAPRSDVPVEAARTDIERDRLVRERALRAADDKVARAERELARAQAELEAGRVISDNEWIGNKNGTVRPRQSYVDRVAALEANVARAKERLDSAYEQRNFLR